MLDLDSLFAAGTGGNPPPKLSSLADPVAPSKDGGRGQKGGNRSHIDDAVKIPETQSGQGIAAVFDGSKVEKNGTTGTSERASQSAFLVPEKPFGNNELSRLGPVGPLGPVFFTGEGRKTDNRAPGGGAAVSLFALHPAAAILLIAYCRQLEISPQEQAEALIELGQLPPGEQVRRWQMACIQQGIEPWSVLSIQAPPKGADCSLCVHLLTRQYSGDNGRRQFHWACGQGYLILETGRGTERIWIAPPECQSFERWYPSNQR